MADATDMLECIRDDVPWTNMWYPVFLSIKFNGTRLADIPNEAFQFDDCDLEDFDYAFGAYRDLVKMGCGHHEDFDLEMCDKQDYGSQDITDYNEDDEFVCVICEAERKAEETAKTVRHEKMEVAIAKAVTKKGPARGEKEDTVYYIEAVGQNIIKIGHSIDPQTRRKNLQTVPTVKLVVLATEPGGQPKEALRHAEFTAIRLSPDVEWFHKTPELLAHIERLAADTSCQP